MSLLGKTVWTIRPSATATPATVKMFATISVGRRYSIVTASTIRGARRVIARLCAAHGCDPREVIIDGEAGRIS